MTEINSGLSAVASAGSGTASPDASSERQPDQLVQRADLGYRAPELPEAEGLEQVVRGVEPKSLDSVFRIGRREDHQRLPLQRPHEIEPVEVGHVDIDEDQVDLLGAQVLARREGVGKGGSQLQFGGAADVVADLTERQRLVVDGDALNHGNWGIVS